MQIWKVGFWSIKIKNQKIKIKKRPFRSEETLVEVSVWLGSKDKVKGWYEYAPWKVVPLCKQWKPRSKTKTSLSSLYFLLILLIEKNTPFFSLSLSLRSVSSLDSGYRQCRQKVTLSLEPSQLRLQSWSEGSFFFLWFWFWTPLSTFASCVES